MIPKHLEKILHVSEPEDCTASGQIICECGCKLFGIQYFGEVFEADGDEYPAVSITDYKDGSALAVKAVCRDCGKKYLLFDFAKHGYDGLICGDGVTAPETGFTEFIEGEENSFEVDMTVEFDDEDQFIEEIVNNPPEGMIFAPEDRPNIWSWVVIDLTSAGLGKKIHFVDEELA